MSSPPSADPEVPEALASRLAPELAGRLLELRREIHRHPELSFEEHGTRDRILRFLDALPNARVETVAKTGVVARIRGRNRGSHAVAIRGDMDALPIQEETGLPYASRNEGVMHACGHDVHTTWAAGAACLLGERPPALDVVVIFQPGEETGRGARSITETGVLEGVRAIFGGHVDRNYEVGEVVAQPGPLAASADFFTVNFQGTGGHAARPHETSDPLAAAASAVVQLNGLAPRRVEPDRHSTLSVTRFRSGDAKNVVPSRAELAGTIRATDEETRKVLERTLERVMRATAAGHDIDVSVDIARLVPPLVNDGRVTGWMREAATEVLGPDAVVPLRTVNLAGEDFAHYLAKIPGCFIRVGAREPGGEKIPAHSPRFVAADSSVFVGTVVLAEAARRAARALV